MCSIDDTTHGEQEDEEDEWEIVWESADPWQEILRTQKRISDAPQILLDNIARMQTNAQIEPPIFAVLRRAEQNAAAAMPAWLENLNRTEEMLKRAQNLRPRRRRKQSANMPIDRQLPEQPSMTPQREDMPPVVPSQTDIEPPKRKRGPGRLPGETFNSMEEVRDTLLRLTRDNRKIPSQRLVAQNLPLLVSVDAVQDYAAYWFGGWRGVKRMCAEYLRKVEAEQASAGRDN